MDPYVLNISALPLSSLCGLALGQLGIQRTLATSTMHVTHEMATSSPCGGWQEFHKCVVGGAFVSPKNKTKTNSVATFFQLKSLPVTKE